MKDDELVQELIGFLGFHFHKNTDAKRYILYSDLIDFIWENTDLNIMKVKKLLSAWPDLELHNGKVYGLFCFTYPDLNQIEDDISSSDDDDEELEYTSDEN